VDLSEGDRPERISAAAVSPSFFSVVSSFLFGILPTDPGMMVGAVLLLVLAAVAASLLPALAASRVEPASVLRYE
jgi:ABC-type lipoprotein release transport system permease subunit